MRSLLPVLVLLAACGTAPADVAPTADPSASAQTALARLDSVERRADQLVREVVNNRHLIAELQQQLSDQQATIETLQGLVIEIGSTVSVQGGNLEIHDNALFRTDPNTGITVNRLDALEARGAVVEDFAVGLSGGDTSSGTATPDDLRATLFVVDADGSVVPGVDGLRTELRKRPDLLVAEWDQLLDEHMSSLSMDPNSTVGTWQADLDATAAFAQGLAVEVQLADDALRRQVNGLMCDTCVARGEVPPSGPDSCLETEPVLVCGTTPHF